MQRSCNSLESGTCSTSANSSARFSDATSGRAARPAWRSYSLSWPGVSRIPRTTPEDRDARAELAVRDHLGAVRTGDLSVSGWIRPGRRNAGMGEPPSARRQGGSPARPTEAESGNQRDDGRARAPRPTTTTARRALRHAARTGPGDRNRASNRSARAAPMPRRSELRLGRREQPGQTSHADAAPPRRPG
jgi:hypothetical protein